MIVVVRLADIMRVQLEFNQRGDLEESDGDRIGGVL